MIDFLEKIVVRSEGLVGIEVN